MRTGVARNPSTPPEMLSTLDEHEHKKLSNHIIHKDWFMRCQIAAHPSTPPETLTTLAKDEDWMVREAVAANPKTYGELLLILFQDETKEVRRAVTDNPNLLTCLQNLAEQDGVCAEDTKMPAEWLQKMYLT